jgi:hypothetical protein
LLAQLGLRTGSRSDDEVAVPFVSGQLTLVARGVEVYRGEKKVTYPAHHRTTLQHTSTN